MELDLFSIFIVTEYTHIIPGDDEQEIFFSDKPCKPRFPQTSLFVPKHRVWSNVRPECALAKSLCMVWACLIPVFGSTLLSLFTDLDRFQSMTTAPWNCILTGFVLVFPGIYSSRNYCFPYTANHKESHNEHRASTMNLKHDMHASRQDTNQCRPPDHARLASKQCAHR